MVQQAFFNELELPCNDISFENLENLQFVDLYHGEVLQGAICDPESGTSWFSRINIEAGGYGGVLLTETIDDDLASFMNRMAVMSQLPLSSYDDEWKPLQQVIEAVEPSIRKQKSFVRDENFILVEGGTLDFNVTGNCIEGDRIPEGLDVQFPWETHPQRSGRLEKEMLY